MADADQVRLSYVEESTFGTHPGGSMNELRYTSEGLKQETSTTQSAEITSSRMTQDVIRTELSATGDINFELSYGSFDDFLGAVLMNTWVSGTPDSLVNGSTIRSFAFEKEYRDLSNVLAEYLGVMVNTWSMSIAPGSIITGTFGLMGLSETSLTSSNGSGYTSANTNQVMNAIDHVTSFKEAGSAVDCPTEFSLELTNNLRNRMCITKAKPKDIRPGSIGLTGSYQKYFTDATLIDKYLNFGETSFEFTVADDAGNQYVVSIPKVKFTDGQRVAGGEDSDVIAEMSWTAKKDPSTGNMIKITRTPA